MEYVSAAAGVWFLGFFPLGELVLAVPLALSTGLDNVSAVVWSVLGNMTPLIIIHFGFEALMRAERIKAWMTRLVSDSAKARFDRWGVWFILLATPWIGVWAMGVTAKALRIDPRRFIIASFLSVSVYAVIFVIICRMGEAMLQ